MNQQFLESVMDKDRKIAKDVAVGIISPEGKVRRATNQSTHGTSHCRTEDRPTPFIPVIYGVGVKDDDWTDRRYWKKANPSLGITVIIDKVKDACESAKQNPGEENSFRQLVCNQWVKQAVRWMPMNKWDKMRVCRQRGRSGRSCLLRRSGLVLHYGHYGIRIGIPAAGR